jgi:hypothetical protein
VTRALLLTAVTTAIAIGTACSNDRAINSICGFPQPGFDIEEASTLQDGQGYAGMHDAVVLTFEEAIDLPASSSWRVRSVEIMPLINQFEFDFYPDGSWVTVEVWDGDDPTQTEPWRVSQQFFKTEHEWTAVTLNDPTTAFPGTHMQTWWRFGFDDFIPTSGMDSTNYLVGVNWDTSGAPPLGYSNFNNSCSANWTDYNAGVGWELNGINNPGVNCSWPMLKVNLEVLEQSDECEGERYSFE